MRANPTSQTAHPNFGQIAILAYQIWEHEGCSQGRDYEHWVEVEAQLKATGQRPPSGSIQHAITTVLAPKNDKLPRAQRTQSPRRTRARLVESVAI